jgi:methylated-DNA-[protein]-cysteine S-methyltransferase
MSSTLADRVYKLLVTVPKGKVTTYKALGDALGTKAYRAIGQALRRNPFAPEVPCHRVVSSDGTIGGFMGYKTGETIDKKIRLLTEEGVRVTANKVSDFTTVFHSFS